MPVGAAELKAQGNEEYKKKNFKKALELYTTLIETLKSESNPDREQLSIAYRNRCAANVELFRFLQGLHDARMSYAKQPTGNWKACLRATLCTLRICDLSAADKWLKQAKRHAPTPSNAIVSAKIQEMQELIGEKLYFVSGGPFTKLKATEAINLLQQRIREGKSFEDVPFLLYRLRFLLRVHFYKMKPDCDDFDIKDAPEDAGGTHNISQQWDRTLKGDFPVKDMKDLSFKLNLMANQLVNGHKADPDPSRMAKLMKTPGCEDLFLSDLPDITPQQETLFEGGYMWERSLVLGETLDTEQPMLRNKEEAEAVKRDIAARLMCQFTLRVLLGLVTMENATGKRAFQQMGMIYSRPAYRGTCGEAFQDGIRYGLPHNEFVRGLVLNGGLVGLAYDIVERPLLFDKPFASTLDHISTEVFKEIPVEDIGEAVEWLGDKLQDYHPDCPCCREKCPEETATAIARAFVHMYEARGRKPFLLGARFTASIKYYVSRLWPEQPTGKPKLNPIKVQTWMDLFSKWGAMHMGLQIHYELPTALPSRKATILRASKEENVCCNPNCDGSRAVYASNGLRKYKQCSKCKRYAYCSKECQAEDWAEHKKKCGKPLVAPPGTAGAH